MFFTVTEITFEKTEVTARLDSPIVSSFPQLFDEFRANQFLLLSGGSRDGFGLEAFTGDATATRTH
jgi:hypothetical protein